MHLLRSRFTVRDGCIPPRRAHDGDAGLDLALQKDCFIEPGETRYIPSGVSFRIDRGYCVHIMTRSSTFTRGVIVIPTIVDQSYSGEASVIVTNISGERVQLHRGDSIAQAVQLPYYVFANECEANMNQRSGKFGSSGTALNEGACDD